MSNIAVSPDEINCNRNYSLCTCDRILSDPIPIPAPSLYKAFGTHQRSKKHEIRGYYKENSHVLEIMKKGVFFAEKSAILGKRGDIFDL